MQYTTDMETDVSVSLSSQGKKLTINEVDAAIHFVWKNNVSAVVKLCRKLEDKQTICNQKLDTDCDGLIDSADPDCAAVLNPCNKDGKCTGR